MCALSKLDYGLRVCVERKAQLVGCQIIVVFYVEAFVEQELVTVALITVVVVLALISSIEICL